MNVGNDRLAMKPYQKRAIAFLELWSPGDWNIKVYGITSPSRNLEQTLIEAAKDTISFILPSQATEEGRHGVGFMGIHAADDGNFLFVDWWWNENELYHYSFIASPGSNVFHNVTSTGRMFCIWELYVLGYEREAWIQWVLDNDLPDIEQYLQSRLNKNV
ncbi:isochorismatase [Thermoactinomyces sp. CICC 10521]|uniref:isochorismatase n=1 Tax=Thermoactinomyces sp. CICC 10521 TaxID=2767426 RepID=UPI0018DE1F29|nr:isochorismatase [Thermoactinomyces sp. CICC 10521]MBH8608766.1 isochorismatase [Thermoactinomyces sp. CICC 10521]